MYSNTAQCSICQVSGRVVLATLLGDAVAMVMLDADGQRKSSACRLAGSPYLVRNSGSDVTPPADGPMKERGPLIAAKGTEERLTPPRR